MIKVRKGSELFKIGDLMTDMILKGARVAEMERIITHSMLVLAVERSENDNNIAQLRRKYQGAPDGELLEEEPK